MNSNTEQSRHLVHGRDAGAAGNHGDVARGVQLAVQAVPAQLNY